MRYTVILHKEEDGGYVATVPVLPGCVSQGDTRDEAPKNIEEAIEVYLEDVRAAGEPVPVEDRCKFFELLPNINPKGLSVQWRTVLRSRKQACFAFSSSD